MTAPSHRIDPIQVWHAASSTAQPGAVESCCQSWLDDSELQRADRFRQPTSRNQHVVGRGMTRRLLGGDQLDPKSIRFHTEVHGKPFVAAPDAAKRPFNIAHTHGLVMCGIADRSVRLLGIDVERLDRNTTTELAERYFSVPEVQYLQRVDGETQRRQQFLRIWTLKESFIKAMGTGLHTPLADFAFEQIETDTPKIRMLNPKLHSELRWSFFSIQPRPGFIGAIAVATPPEHRAVAFELRSFEEWLQSRPPAR